MKLVGGSKGKFSDLSNDREHERRNGADGDRAIGGVRVAISGSAGLRLYSTP